MSKYIGEGSVFNMKETRIELCKDSKYEPFWNKLQESFNQFKEAGLIDCDVDIHTWFSDCSEREDTNLSTYRKFIAAIRDAATLLNGCPVLVDEWSPSNKCFEVYQTTLTGALKRHTSSGSLWGLAADKGDIRSRSKEMFVHFFEILPQ